MPVEPIFLRPREAAALAGLSTRTPVGSCPMTTTACATRSSATRASSTLLPQRSRKRSAMRSRAADATSNSASATSSTPARCTRPPPATRSGSRSRLRRPTAASSTSDFAMCSSASSSTRPRPSSGNRAPTGLLASLPGSRSPAWACASRPDLTRRRLHAQRPPRQRPLRRRASKLAAKQRLASPLHALLELLTMSVDVFVDRNLDELGLLEPGHQRGVADLLLGGLVDLDWRLSACHAVPRYRLYSITRSGRGGSVSQARAIRVRCGCASLREASCRFVIRGGAPGDERVPVRVARTPLLCVVHRASGGLATIAAPCIALRPR
jgi:hypothetical protein